MPKSPRWLVQQDRIEEALNALKTVRDESEAEAELEEIIESHEKAKAICSKQLVTFWYMFALS